MRRFPTPFQLAQLIVNDQLDFEDGRAILEQFVRQIARGHEARRSLDRRLIELESRIVELTVARYKDDFLTIGAKIDNLQQHAEPRNLL